MRTRSNDGVLRRMKVIYALTDIFGSYIFALAYTKEAPLMSTQSAVQEKYGSIARSVTQSGSTACCDPAMRCCDPITKNLYSELEHRSEEHTSELQSLRHLVCRLLLEKKKKPIQTRVAVRVSRTATRCSPGTCAQAHGH